MIFRLLVHVYKSSQILVFGLKRKIFQFIKLSIHTCIHVRFNLQPTLTPYAIINNSLVIMSNPE